MRAKYLLLMVKGFFLLFTLSACGGGGGGGSEAAAPADTQPPADQPVVSTLEVSGDFPYRVTVLETPGEQSYALALNDEGQVAGNYRDAGGNLHAFIWKDRTVRTVAENAEVADINAIGQVVGWSTAGGLSQAYFWDRDGSLYDLPAMEAPNRALAINDLGQTAGRIIGAPEQAFFEDYGRLERIAPQIDGYAVDLNDTGQMLIKDVANGMIRSLLWSDGELIDLGTLGGDDAQAEALNEAGQVVGWSQTATGATRAFLWEDGTMHDLGSVAGDFSSAVAINDRGQVLLKASSVGGDRTLLYEAGEVVDLGNFGTRYAVVTDINNQGQITGWLETAAGSLRAFIATPR